MQEKSKAQIAYETYNQSRGSILWVRWSALTLEEVNAWYDVVNAITLLPMPATTPPDPALLLARRIARISVETGLKPRIVYDIVRALKWDAEEAAEKAAEKAAEAPAPQENPTDE